MPDPVTASPNDVFDKVRKAIEKNDFSWLENNYALFLNALVQKASKRKPVALWCSVLDHIGARNGIEEAEKKATQALSVAPKKTYFAQQIHKKLSRLKHPKEEPFSLAKEKKAFRDAVSDFSPGFCEMQKALDRALKKLHAAPDERQGEMPGFLSPHQKTSLYKLLCETSPEEIAFLDRAVCELERTAPAPPPCKKRAWFFRRTAAP